MTVDEIFAPFIVRADEPSAETEADMKEVRRFLYKRLSATPTRLGWCVTPTTATDRKQRR